MGTQEEASEIKRQHSAELLAQPGVWGVGVERDTNGNYVIAVHVDNDHPDVLSLLPQQIEGYPVKLVYSGPFRKEADS